MIIYQGGSIWWDGDSYATALKLDGCSMKWQSFVLLIWEPPRFYHDGTGIMVLFTPWFLFPVQHLRVSHVYLDWLLVGEPCAWAPVETTGAKSCLPSPPHPPYPPTIHCPSPFSSASVPRRWMTATHSSLQTAGCLLFLLSTPETGLVTVLFASRVCSCLHFHVVQGTKVSGRRFQDSEILDNLSWK